MKRPINEYDLGAGDVAYILNVTHQTVRRWARTRQLPCINIAGRWRFNREEIERSIKEATQHAQSSGSSEAEEPAGVDSLLD